MASSVSGQTEQAPYFGKYQHIVGMTYFQFCYFIWYFATFHMFYCIFTLNFQVLLFYAVFCALQSRVKKSDKYVKFINTVIQPRKSLRQVEIIYEQNIGDEQKCLFGFHPHGVLSASVLAFMNFDNGPMKNMVGLASRFMLNLPLGGLIIRLWGVQAVNAKNLKKLMKQGTNVGLVPGGFEEATITVQDQLRIYLKNRKGFIKYALENNYGIYPVLAVNEHKYFWTFRYFEKIRLWFNKFKFPGVIFWNKQTGILMPFDAHFLAIVGKGIKGKVYKEGEKATEEEINKAHAEYIEQIKRIHAKHYELSKVPLKFY